jgi:predicted Rossmann fold nucleotide-binding protein DprA/Smf involved in DNA uptake
MQHTEALAKQIEGRIAELKSEIDSCERALAALRGPEAASARAATSSNGGRTRSRRGRSASSRPRGDGAPATRPQRSQTASAEAVFDALKDGQDQASAIAKQFGVSPAVVRTRLLELEGAGRVSRTGNRRSTRWRSHAG